MAIFASHRLPREAEESLAQALAVDGRRVRPRILASAATLDGALVALPDRLAILGPGGLWQTELWHQILRATWSDDGSRFLWRTVAEPGRERALEVSDPGKLPEVVQERITQTIVMQQRVEIAPGKRVVVTGRRPATGPDSEVRWLVVPARGVDLTQPVLAEATRRLLERVKEDWA